MPPRKSKKSTRISQAPINLSTCPEEEEENATAQKTRPKVAMKVVAKDDVEAESAVIQFQRALQLSKPNKTLIRKLYTQRMELVRLTDKDQMRRAFWEPIFMSEPEGAKLAGYFLAEIGYEPFMDLLAKIVQKNNVTKTQLRGIGEALVIAYKLAEKNDQVMDMNGVEEVWRWVIDCSVIAAVPLDERFLEITKALDDADRVKFEMVLQKMLNAILPQYARCLDARARFETMNYVFRFYPLFPLLQEDREKLILDYLKDECVEIRCQATMKTMVIFESFFNIIPEDFIQHVMIEVIDSMAKDANSSVRACVYKGLRSLSQCAGAVNILEHAMRCIIVDGVNDKHEKVRLATFQLLNAVREHRFIRFWDVVEVNLLLARFEVETDEKVLEQIVRLLFRSFHPKDQTPTKIVARLERLVKDGGRNAAVNFCRHIYRLGLITIEQAVVLIKTILGLNVYGRWKKNDLGVDLSRLALDESIIDAVKNYNSENKENADSDEPEETLDDKATTPEFSRHLVLFECGVVMWKAIQKDLEPESELECQIERIVLHIFRILHEKYSDTALIGASFILGALVRTKNAAMDMQKFASQEIENFKKGDYSSENLGFLLNFIWKWEPEKLLNLVLDDLSMLSQLRGDVHKSPPKKMKKQSESPVDSLLRIPLVLSHLTTSQKISADITTNHAFYLERFFQKLSPSLPIIFDMYLSTDARVKINGQITVELFKVHLAIFEQLLATALNAGRGAPPLVNILESLRAFVDWFIASAIPRLNELLENEDPRWLDTFRIVEAVFEVQPLVLGLLKCGETLSSSKEETREVCDNLFTSLCCLYEALFNKGSPLQQLLLALTGLKNLAALHGVYDNYLLWQQFILG
ncbi:unnamed protein product, partial [Mesorhabditis belari]|uniref:Condensin complex subunit 1 n=1 Tax=Mesorhabditis belari TaxID=2138241 RepID=A0AAF3EGF2_9BILA